jgi:hypothetical protein
MHRYLTYASVFALALYIKSFFYFWRAIVVGSMTRDYFDRSAQFNIV